MDRVSVTDRFQCQSRELRAESCPVPEASSPSLAACVSPPLAPHPLQGPHSLSASRGPAAPRSEVPGVGRPPARLPLDSWVPWAEANWSAVAPASEASGIASSLKEAQEKPLGTKDSPTGAGHPQRRLHL